MSLLDRLEHRFGRFAITGLIRYVVVLNGLVYILFKLNPMFLVALVLNRYAVQHGEVWRLVTYIFIPQMGSFLPDWISVAFYLLFLWWIGNGLEQAWGAFRVNVYFFTGMLGITVSSFLFGAAFANPLLTSTLLFAMAHTYPDEVIYMYLIPMRIKWLAWIDGAFLAYQFLTSGDLSFQAGMLVAVANYLLFFGPEIYRSARLHRQVAERRRKFQAAQAPEESVLHRCAICQRTEVSNPELDFRVSRDGQEYCTEHLPKAPVAAS